MIGQTEYKLRRSRLLLVTAVLVLISDQVSKAMVRANMTLGQSIPETGKFRLTYSTNKGAVFGVGMDSVLLVVLSGLMVILIIWGYFQYLRDGGTMVRLGMGLVLGGALGNFTDRLRVGRVTDFIDVRLWGSYHWPAFNVADASLSTGIAIVVVSLVMFYGRE